MKALKKALKKDDIRTAVGSVAEKFGESSEFSVDVIENIISSVGESCESGAGKLSQALRGCVTGGGIGADLFETISILGKDKCISRINAALAIDFDAEG